AKWNQLTAWQQERFLPFCPDFVIELLSPRDKLETTQNKILEYLENGTALAWLINRKLKQVEIYRSGKVVEIVENPETLSGELVLPNFILTLENIW
ncbi:MAG: Uma2 family endonuclease, partial [Microcystaceae cyanobacterium]